MNYSFSLAGSEFVMSFKVGATVADGGVPVILDTNKYGDVIPCTTTAAADAYGLALKGATYAAATEATVEVVMNPFAIFRASASGGATAGTALSAATKNVLTQTSASQTVITASDAPTNDFTYGSAIALSGANAGLRRAITSRSSGASVTTTVYFPSSVAVGDKVLVLPWKPGSVAVQTTSAFSEANAIIAVGTGIDVDVLDIQIDKPINTTNPIAWVYFMLGDHNFNQLS